VQINPIIRTRTRYFRHACPPTRENTDIGYPVTEVRFFQRFQHSWYVTPLHLRMESDPVFEKSRSLVYFRIRTMDEIQKRSNS
jgi:hypothetical protein